MPSALPDTGRSPSVSTTVLTGNELNVLSSLDCLGAEQPSFLFSSSLCSSWKKDWTLIWGFIIIMIIIVVENYDNSHFLHDDDPKRNFLVKWNFEERYLLFLMVIIIIKIFKSHFKRKRRSFFQNFSKQEFFVLFGSQCRNFWISFFLVIVIICKTGRKWR